MSALHSSYLLYLCLGVRVVCVWCRVCVVLLIILWHKCRFITFSSQVDLLGPYPPSLVFVAGLLLTGSRFFYAMAAPGHFSLYLLVQNARKMCIKIACHATFANAGV